MASADSQYDIEWQALEAICRGLDADDNSDDILSYLGEPRFSWGRLLHYAVAHKLLGVLAWCLLRDRYASTIPHRLAAQLSEILTVNRWRIEVCAREILRIVVGGRQRGLCIIPRKGIVYDHTMFSSRGVRQFSDLDFMIRPQDQTEVRLLLKDLGYQFGKYDPCQRAQVPPARHHVAAYLLGLDHMPMHVRRTDDPVIRFIHVDVGTTFTWPKSEFADPIEEAFAELVPLVLPGVEKEVQVLSPTYQVLDTVLELFQEAFIENTCHDGNPTTLGMFLDVRMLLRHYRLALVQSGFPTLIKRLELALPISWVLAHLDALFESSTLDEIGLEDLACSKWLAGWRPLTGNALGSWHGDMRRRLYDGGHLPGVV